jgi:UDP-glucose 4-epimerase
MKILVTGATGRVGSVLCQELTQHGYSVRAMVEPGDPNLDRIQDLPRIEVVRVDLRMLDPISRAAENVDAIVHLAAQMARGNTPVDEFFDVNTLGTLRVLEAARRAGGDLKRVVLASTDGTYRPAFPKYQPIDERHPQEPGDYYGTSKLLAEILIKNYGLQFDIPWTILRYGSIVGPSEVLHLFRYRFASGLLRRVQRGRESFLEPLFRHAGRPWETLDRLVADPTNDPAVVLAGPDGAWSVHLTDVRDVVAGTVAALESPNAVHEELNIVGPETVSFARGAKLIAHALKLPVVHADVGVRFAFELDVSKARRLLGYRPKWNIDDMIAFAVSQGLS